MSLVQSLKHLFLFFLCTSQFNWIPRGASCARRRQWLDSFTHRNNKWLKADLLWSQKWKFMAKQPWSITRTDYSLMWLKNMCGMKSSVALRYFGNNFCQVIYGYRIIIFWLNSYCLWLNAIALDKEIQYNTKCS